MRWHERPFGSAELPEPSARECVEIYEQWCCMFFFPWLHSVSYGELTTCLAVSVCVVEDPEMIVQRVQLLHEEWSACLLPSHVCWVTCDSSQPSDVQYHDYAGIRLPLADAVPMLLNHGVYLINSITNVHIINA